MKLALISFNNQIAADSGVGFAHHVQFSGTILYNAGLTDIRKSPSHGWQTYQVY